MVFPPVSMTVYESDPIIVDSELSERSAVKDDLPSVATLTQNDSIQPFVINFKDAVERFNRVMLNESGPNGYKASLAETSEGESISATCKLSELTAELEELKQMVANDPEELVGERELQYLQQRLECAKRKLHADHERQDPVDPELGFSTICPLDPAALSKLSDRVNNIMERLGSDPNDFRSFLTPLLVSLRDLRLQLDSLQETNSKSIVNTDLTAVLQQIQDYHKNSNNDSIQRINALFELVNKWNTECQILPQLVEKLTECAGLSEQAKRFIGEEKPLEKDVAESVSQIKALGATMDLYRPILSQLVALRQQL